MLTHNAVNIDFFEKEILTEYNPAELLDQNEPGALDFWRASARKQHACGYSVKNPYEHKSKRQRHNRRERKAF